MKTPSLVQSEWTRATRRGQTKPDFKKLARALGLNDKLVSLYPPKDVSELVERYDAQWYKSFCAGSGDEVQECLAGAFAQATVCAIANKYNQVASAQAIKDVINNKVDSSCISKGISTLVAEEGFSDLRISVGGKTVLLEIRPVIADTLEVSFEMFRYNSCRMGAGQCVLLIKAKPDAKTPLHAVTAHRMKEKDAAFVGRNFDVEDSTEVIVNEENFVEMLLVDVIVQHPVTKDVWTSLNEDAALEGFTRSMDEASTAPPSQDDSDLESVAVSTVNESLQEADRADASALLNAAIHRNAEFLEQLPAMNQAHRDQLRSCELTAEDLAKHEAALEAINDEIGTVSGVAVEVHKRALQVVELRRKGVTTLQTFKLEADDAPDEMLHDLASRAVANLEVSQVESAELMQILHSYRAAAGDLERMCNEESKALQAVIAKKGEQSANLLRQIADSQRRLATDFEFLKSGRAAEEVERAHERVNEETTRLQSLYQAQEEAQAWYANANAVCKVGILAAGGVAVGCVVLTGLSLISLSPLAILGLVVGAGVGGVAGAAMVGTLIVSGLMDQQREQEDIVSVALVEEAQANQAASVASRNREEEQQAAMQAQFDLLEEEIVRLSQQDRQLEKHKATLSELRTTLKAMASHLKHSDLQANGMLALLGFFDIKGATAIERCSGPTKAKEIRAYVQMNLRSDLFEQWAKKLDQLEKANDRLLEAVLELSAPKA